MLRRRWRSCRTGGRCCQSSAVDHQVEGAGALGGRGQSRSTGMVRPTSPCAGCAGALSMPLRKDWEGRSGATEAAAQQPQTGPEAGRAARSTPLRGGCCRAVRICNSSRSMSWPSSGWTMPGSGAVGGRLCSIRSLMRQSGRKLSPRACSTSAYSAASRGRRAMASSSSTQSVCSSFDAFPSQGSAATTDKEAELDDLRASVRHNARVSLDAIDAVDWSAIPNPTWHPCDDACRRRARPATPLPTVVLSRLLGLRISAAEKWAKESNRHPHALPTLPKSPPKDDRGLRPVSSRIGPGQAAGGRRSRQPICGRSHRARCGKTPLSRARVWASSCG
ncbi:hypothetical protein RKD18_000326 [Streptomyces phaeoluteigriseus]